MEAAHLWDPLHLFLKSQKETTPLIRSPVWCTQYTKRILKHIDGTRRAPSQCHTSNLYRVALAPDLSNNLQATFPVSFFDPWDVYMLYNRTETKKPVIYRELGRIQLPPSSMRQGFIIVNTLKLQHFSSQKCSFGCLSGIATIEPDKLP